MSLRNNPHHSRQQFVALYQPSLICIPLENVHIYCIYNRQQSWLDDTENHVWASSHIENKLCYYMVECVEWLNFCILTCWRLNISLSKSFWIALIRKCDSFWPSSLNRVCCYLTVSTWHTWVTALSRVNLTLSCNYFITYSDHNFIHDHLIM